MARIFMKSFGCALNTSDSEAMAGILENEGHKIVNDEGIADLVIINSCTVKNEAESKLYREIRRHNGKKIIIAGCVAQAEKGLIDTKLKGFSIIGPSRISSIGLVAEQTLEGNRVVLLDKEKKNLNIPRIRKNRIVQIIPISEGCLGNCSYCKVRHARGSLSSYPPKDLIKMAKTAIKEGAKELWLTSQDTGAYGLDINKTLPDILNMILDLKGDFKVRLGMCNPNFALAYLDEISSILKHPKMFRFIHLPVQSGSNRILRLMNRKYTKEDFKRIVKRIKNEANDVTIATDVIVGFPTESDKDFDETLDLVKELKPDILNMSRFWGRPGTLAADMEKTDSKTIKQRSRKIRQVFERIALENNQRWVGWKGDVIVEEKGKNNTLTARNYAYKPIIVKKKGCLLGDKVNVVVRSATSWDLRE